MLLLVVSHNNREVAMSKERRRSSHQLTMVFADTGLWEQIPEKNRLRCRTLLTQLFDEVIRGEQETKRSDDGREDSTTAP